MSHQRKILSYYDRPRESDGRPQRLIDRYLQDFLKTDLAEDPRYRDSIILGGISVRANMVEKWEETRNAYHLRLNPPTATICALDGPDIGQLETIGLRHLLDFLLRQESKVG
jgi:hypothetical protein